MKKIFRFWDGEDFFYSNEHGSLESFFAQFDNGLYDLEYCSNIKDKNNKFIFEGDIIKHNFLYTDKRDVIGIVKFGKYEDDEGYSTFIHLGFYVDEINNSGQHSLIDFPEGGIEIIGNIHKKSEFKND